MESSFMWNTHTLITQNNTVDPRKLIAGAPCRGGAELQQRPVFSGPFLFAAIGGFAEAQLGGQRDRLGLEDEV